MRPLSAGDVLHLWERGQHQHPVDRALSLIAAAAPEFPWDDLVRLSVGQRDDLLLAVREHCFEPRMDGFISCPQCQERLEFALNIPDLRDMNGAAPEAEEHVLTAEGLSVRYRLPNSADLAAIARYTDVDAARQALVRRCVLDARRQDDGAPVDTLPESVVSALSSDMEARDPQAELRMELNCSACGHQWYVLLDVLSFLWTELSSEARRILYEIHLLARTYGWSEGDILSMSRGRRQLYLEMAG